MRLDSDLREVKGIGDKTARLFHKLELYTVRDLLYYLPKGYEHFERPKSIEEWKKNSLVTLRIKLPYQRMELRKAGRYTLLQFYLEDGAERVYITYFNMPFLKNTLIPGQEYVFRGKLEEKKGRLVMDQPKFYSPSEYENLLDTLQPVYVLTKGLTSAFLQKAVKYILQNTPFGEEIFPEEIMQKYGLIGAKEAFYTLHFPKKEEQVIEARRRLVFEEFLAFCLEIKLRKKETVQLPFLKPLFKTADTARLLEQLPYSLTGAQKRVWKQIEEDLEKDVAMNRMVQGDVGSGKTILAILALLMCAANGRQGAFMAPTEVLARQHYEALSEMNRQYGVCIRPILLVGSMTAKEKKTAYEEIREGKVNVIVGTHALIQEKVCYRNLALVITDEQHRFGVRQRTGLQEKGENTHILVMSATPIPRTLAIILFGDLHLSVLDEMPVGRLPIKNCVVDPSYRPKAYQFMEKEILKGHQIYCICPMVEEGEMENLENVVDYARKLSEYFGSKARVAYLHGKMKPAMKNQVMEEFGEHKIDILVSTTVIEVGINVPNATVMMVENAERFGLAQLHQLRGRVGRGKEQSYCIFINGNQNENTSKRLELLNRSNDGFYLAKEDMKLRGPGDIFGIRQSGDMEFAVGDIYGDADILMETAALAEELLAEDKAKNLIPMMEELCVRHAARVDFRSI